jgi:hypothetical protein
MMTEREHTAEFDEVMQHPPNRVTRYGHWLLLLLLVVLAVLAWCYRRLIF